MVLWNSKSPEWCRLRYILSAIIVPLEVMHSMALPWLCHFCSKCHIYRNVRARVINNDVDCSQKSLCYGIGIHPHFQSDKKLAFDFGWPIYSARIISFQSKTILVLISCAKICQCNKNDHFN